MTGRHEVRLRLTTDGRREMARIANAVGMRPNQLLALILSGQLAILEGRSDQVTPDMLRVLAAAHGVPYQLPGGDGD